MIRAHEVNCLWTGQQAGIVADPALFECKPDEIRAELAAWDWVEVRAALDAEVCARIARANFVQVDTQIRFRIALAAVEKSPSLEGLAVAFADETPFKVGADELADFLHERFSVLPGMVPAELNRRYAIWGERLVEEYPGTCLRVLAGGKIEGWFLGRSTPKGLELTLAMLHRDATISGHLLYHRALRAYHARGVRLGFAAFSVTNTPVHNIYASLGARFLSPEGCWLWRAGGL